jgi:hypothetical protein
MDLWLKWPQVYPHGNGQTKSQPATTNRSPAALCGGCQVLLQLLQVTTTFLGGAAADLGIHVIPEEWGCELSSPTHGIFLEPVKTIPPKKYKSLKSIKNWR